MKLFLIKQRSMLLSSFWEDISKIYIFTKPLIKHKQTNLAKRLFYSLEKKRNNAQLEKDSLLVSAYERELLEIQMKIENLNTIFKQKYTTYYQLKYPELKIKPNDIMSKLGDSTVMLEYFQGKQRSFVFVLRIEINKISI